MKKNNRKESKKVEKKQTKNSEKRENTKKAKGYYSKKITLAITIVAILVVLGLIAYVVNTIIQKNNYVGENPVATIDMGDLGIIKVELYPNYAPNTVANFIALANNGFYDGLTFHRTIPDFMIQGGDPNGDGTGSAKLSDVGKEGDSNYVIKGEFIINKFTQNTLKHTRGVISMARGDYSSIPGLATKGYNSACCQFFIMTTDNTSLDGLYASFGKVIDGMDVVDNISNVEVETRDSSDENLTADRPKNPPVIKSIRVDTHGVDYGLPETQEPFDYYSYLMNQQSVMSGQ